MKDISTKTRSALNARAAAGKYLSSGIYGYQKDPNDKNHLIPDPETAPVVRRIYNMAISGLGFRTIARTLSDEGILTPSAVKGVAPRNKSTRPTNWSTVTVGNIIRNPVYLGKLIYGKFRKVSYKSKKIVASPENQRIITEGVHEPLVSQAVWDLANEIASRHKKPCRNGETHIFSGLLFCQDCGSSMTRERVSYVCYRYRNYGKSENGCSSHRIPYELLYASVLASVQEVTEAARRDRDGLIEKLSGMGQKKQQTALANVRKDQARTEKRLADIGELIRKAFEKNALGSLPDDMYSNLVSGYAKERDELTAHLATVTDRIADLTAQTGNAAQFVKLVEQCADVTELDRELLHRLIDRIEIGEHRKENGVRFQEISIYFRFVGKI